MQQLGGYLVFLTLVSYTLSINYGLNMSLKDPFQGQRFTMGQLPLDQQNNKIGYYTLALNKKNQTGDDVPQILGNPGGPALSAFIFNFSGVGPYKIDYDTGEISLNELYTMTNLGDYFLPEFPLGTGWSSSKHPVISIEQNNEDFLSFMQKLSEINPDINKKRPIYMTGGSFAASMLPGFALILLENGWNVKGHINESPFVDINLWLTYYTDNYYRQGTIGYLTFTFAKLLGDLVMYGTKMNIYGAKEMAWFAEQLPIAGFSSTGMIHCSTDTRSGAVQNKCIKSWFYLAEFVAQNNVRKQFKGGDRNMEMMNFDTHDYFYLGTNLKFWANNKFVYDTLFIKYNYKMVILQGVYDPYYSVANQFEWLNLQNYTQNGFVQAKWNENEFGKFKKSGNLCFQVVQTGHVTQLEKPEIAYTQQKNLINTDKVCT